MHCTGRVLRTEGDIARVLIESKACDHCQACGFSTIRDAKIMEVNALNRVGAEKDDVVSLELSGRKVMGASAILFMVPFAGFIIGFLLGYFALWHIFGSQWRTLVSLITAFAFLALSYYPVYLLGNREMDFEFVIRGVGAPESTSPFEA